MAGRTCATRPPKRAGVGERDRREFPGFYASGLWLSGSGRTVGPVLPRPVRCADSQRRSASAQPGEIHRAHAIRQDVANLKAAITGKDVEGFIAALGQVFAWHGLPQRALPERRVYLQAVAEAVREETARCRGWADRTDRRAQFSSQPGCFIPDYSVAEYRKLLEFYVEILITRWTACQRNRSASTRAGEVGTGTARP